MPQKKEIMTIDLNCDMGEGMGRDEAIMPFISSANIACGYHAGNRDSMIQTIELATQYGVAIGAHPSFPDKKNFGRIEMNMTASAIYELVAEQINILDDIARSLGAALHHVKPHGALYNMAARDIEMSATIAKAVKDYDSNLILFGLSGSYLVSEAKKAGLKTASEVFADRTYQDNGSLTSRSETNAMIENPDDAVRQVLQMIKEGFVTTVSGKKISILAETVCIHGDSNHAAEFAKRIHDTLQNENIKIQAIDK